MDAVISLFDIGVDLVFSLYTFIIRWLMPLLAFAVLLRSILPLWQDRKHKKTWAFLYLVNGDRIPVNNWENLIGRSKLADIVINLPFISRNHAVLTFHDRHWQITDLGSKGGVLVNGEKADKKTAVNFGDTITLAGLDMTLLPPDDEREAAENNDEENSYSFSHATSSITFLLVIVFQVLGALQICISRGTGKNAAVPAAFLVFILAECIHYALMRRRSKKSFVLELLGYFLCGFSLLIVASAAPGALYKQLAAIIAGMVVYTILEAVITDLGRAQKIKYVFMAVAAVLMLLNLTIGETYFGSKNWINLGFITFQPMELVKVAFVLAGTATLDRLLTTRNMTAFIAFAGACFVTLALIRDFGTAVVFFGAFVVISFMYSGDIRTLLFVVSAAAFGGFAAVSFMPYIAARFAAWGNVWQYADTSGYQQTRTMIAAASGGLLGVGGGKGNLYRVAAADTDLVFGLLCEEWGLVLALIVVAVIVFFTVHAVFSTKNCRSSFYAIAACGSAAIFLLQTTLNVLGSVDILPLTGVTVPFISNGGTSMITSWGLLALIKSAEWK